MAASVTYGSGRRVPSVADDPTYIPLAAGRCDSYGHGYKRCVRDCLHDGRRHLDIDGRVW